MIQVIVWQRWGCFEDRRPLLISDTLSTISESDFHFALPFTFLVSGSSYKMLWTGLTGEGGGDSGGVWTQKGEG